MRFPIGTVCLIVYAPGRPDTLGKSCVVSGHMKRDSIGHDMLIDIVDEPDVPAAAKCLKPLTGDSGANFTLDKVKKPQKA